jgi:type VI secretion system ImpM family protein
MLGGLMEGQRWAWAAFGKHPSAKDYFQFRLQSSLALAFAQWVENGFGRVPEKSRRQGIYSWRFWSRGLKRGTLVCGLGKSSGDGVGRSYPLMLLGEGRLDRWMQHWHLLPFVLAPVWANLEYCAARRIDNIHQLEADLQRIQAPKPAWKETVRMLPRNRENEEWQAMDRRIAATIREKADDLARQQKMTAALGDGLPTAPLETAGAWHQAFNQNVDNVPSTVFMGGSLHRSFIVFFNRPLAAGDFVDLWTL